MGRTYDDPLEFLFDGAAESLKKGERGANCPEDLAPSPELIDKWEDWSDKVHIALDAWAAGNDHRLHDGDFEDLYNNRRINVPYDVYMPLIGSGVGFTDGDWDYLFKSRHDVITHLEPFLKKELSKAAHDMEAAIYEDAAEQCFEPGYELVDNLDGLSPRHTSGTMPTWAKVPRRSR